jgi:Flp pilus assembly protein TadD
LGQLGEAETAWRRVVEIDPRYAPARVALATCLAGQSRLPEAIDAARTATLVDRDDPWAFVQLGALSLVHEDYGFARESLERALELEADSSAAWYHLGLLSLVTDDLEDAKRCLERAVRAERATPGDEISGERGLTAEATRLLAELNETSVVTTSGPV